MRVANQQLKDQVALNPLKELHVHFTRTQICLVTENAFLTFIPISQHYAKQTVSTYGIRIPADSLSDSLKNCSRD